MNGDIDFHGAKLALYIGNNLLVYRRDDNPAIPFPDMWDFPGGGRENGESGSECAARETREEFGLDIDPAYLIFVQSYANWRGNGAQALFYVGRLPSSAKSKIVFGDEGQGWRLMSERDFLSDERAVPHLQDRLREYLA